MELRLMHIEPTSARAGRLVRALALQVPTARPVRALFLTYASEIEGDAPLIPIQEAVDD